MLYLKQLVVHIPNPFTLINSIKELPKTNRKYDIVNLLVLKLHEANLNVSTQLTSLENSYNSLRSDYYVLRQYVVNLKTSLSTNVIARNTYRPATMTPIKGNNIVPTDISVYRKNKTNNISYLCFIISFSQSSITILLKDITLYFKNR